MNLYQTVLMGGLALPGRHLGTRSVPLMVGPKLSTVLEKIPRVRAVALVKLSFAGGSELTVKSAPFDGPPPGAGFTTVTVLTPPKANRACGIVVVTCVALTTVIVGNGLPFQFTFELLMKFVPFRVRGGSPDPAVAVAGLSGGLMVGAGPVTLRTNDLVGLACPGSDTVTCTAAAAPTRVAVMFAVS